jgi:hypothetical protein
LELATLESQKARAHEALVRGHHHEAWRLYDVLEPVYERYGFADGLLALRYNRLLIALETREAERIGALVARLSDDLRAVESPPGPLARTIASGLQRILADVPRGTDAESVLTLQALAASVAPPIAPPEGHGPQADPFDASPAMLATLHPEDVAALLLGDRLSVPAEGGPGGARWSALVVPPEGLTASGGDPAEAIEAFVRHRAGGDVFRAYQSLAQAFERTWPAAPGAAALIGVGLSALEEAGLPERLDYSPGLPVERRLRLAVELHGRLAAVIGGFAGWEAVARAQWRRLLELADRVGEKVAARTGRGGGRADDAEHEARITVWRARALRWLGDFAGARELLSACVTRAYRCAYTDLAVAADVLLEAADMAERAGHVAEAAKLYADAAEAALPGVLRVARLSEQAALVDESLAEHAPGRVVQAVVALAGQVRTGGESSERGRLLDRARDLLSLARPHLSTTLVGEATVQLELTGARAGDALAAKRAVEAARAIGDRAGVALGTLHRALAARNDSDETQRNHAWTDLARAAAEARRCAAGAVRRVVEIAVGLSHLGEPEGAEAARVAIHLRRAAEALETSSFPDGAGQRDAFLPIAPDFRLDAAVRRLLDAGEVAVARRLCAAARHRDLALPETHRLSTLAAQARAHHRRVFEARFGNGPVVDVAAEAALVEHLGHTQTATPWPRRAPEEGEVRLEFCTFDDFLVVFVVRTDGVRVHRWSESRAGLRNRIAELLRLLRAGAKADRDPVAAARELHQLLIRPLLDDLTDVHRLLIVPDGPLCALPFAALQGDQPLAERFDLAVGWPAPPPRALDTEPAPPAVVIAGDAATGRDLRIATLAREGLYEAVEVRHGDDLGPGDLASALGPARVVHLVGSIEAGPAVALRDGEAPVPVGDLAEALSRGGAVCTTLMGPVEGPLGRQAISTLLTSVQGGVLARQWRADDDGAFLIEFLRHAAGATEAQGLTAALANARRAAIHARMAPRHWAAFELYLAEYG